MIIPGLDDIKRAVRVAAKRAESVVVPVARVAADVGSVLMELERATPLGVVTATARGITSLNEYLVESADHRAFVGTPVAPRTASITHLVDAALTEIADSSDDGESGTFWRFDAARVLIASSESGPMAFAVDPVYKTATGPADDDVVAELRDTLYDEIRSRWPSIADVALDTGDPTRSVVEAVEIGGMPSPRGDEVYALTAPLIRPVGHDGPGRCIILDGPPGTGKTQMARYVAGRVGGRIVNLRFDLAVDMDEYEIGMLVDIVRPDVVLIDDIDKLESDLDNQVLERVRTAARLVVLTANNATEVLDGSLLRSGRVDELFLIDDIGVELIPPEWAAELPEDVAERIRGWSAADLAEVRRRLEARGIDGLGLDDIEARSDMTVHSAGRWFRAHAADAEDDE